MSESKAEELKEERMKNDRTMDWMQLLQDCAQYVQDNEDTAAFSPQSGGKALYNRILHAISVMVPDPNDMHPQSLVWVTREELGKFASLETDLAAMRGRLSKIKEHYELRSELYTNGDDLASALYLFATRPTPPQGKRAGEEVEQMASAHIEVSESKAGEFEKGYVGTANSVVASRGMFNEAVTIIRALESDLAEMRGRVDQAYMALAKMGHKENCKWKTYEDGLCDCGHQDISNALFPKPATPPQGEGRVG